MNTLCCDTGLSIRESHSHLAGLLFTYKCTDLRLCFNDLQTPSQRRLRSVCLFIPRLLLRVQRLRKVIGSTRRLSPFQIRNPKTRSSLSLLLTYTGQIGSINIRLHTILPSHRENNKAQYTSQRDLLERPVTSIWDNAINELKSANIR
ncbi:hypothetical protein EVAR_55898_1 [Eumeta japonica]|uniref:Uncharacterized protein n=1 Tax=Eumeta variegata TaxID=151549 RepID=A0A4C1YL22_EUMVA|nr:hypothetical protein EVAR_55898_1 [Eumeta japonica]